jgi:NAD+ kinase
MMRVLVVYKQSFLEAHRGEGTVLRRLAPPERARLLRDDRENRVAMRDVMSALKRAGADAKAVFRGNLAASPLFDLIVTVGGDGTFFMAAHRAHGTPILGVNSVPRSSLGLFAAANRATFPAMLKKALAGKLPAVRLNRYSVTINDRVRPEFGVNDVLIAHPSPAYLSRFAFSIDGGPVEIQRSSGMWISTAAGSTAAIRAAGGRRMPLASRRLQYLVREPYDWPARTRRPRGYADRTVDIGILMREACLWIDGVRTRVELELGDRIRIETGAEPAVVLGVDVRRRDRLFP